MTGIYIQHCTEYQAQITNSFKSSLNLFISSNAIQTKIKCYTDKQQLLTQKAN
jgi:hypothetical protein